MASQLKRNMGISTINALLSTGLSIISYPMYLHYLGYHRYGIWLLLAVVLTVAQVGNLGLPSALTKLVAEEFGRGNWDEIRAYMTLASILVIGVGLTLCAAALLLRGRIVTWLRLEEADTHTVYALLPWMAALSMVVVFFSTVNAVLGGIGRMDLMSSFETFAQVNGILVAAVFLASGFGIQSLLAANAIGYALALGCSHRALGKRIPAGRPGRSALSRRGLRRLLSIGGWVSGASALTLLLLPFNRLILSRYAGVQWVAVNDLCYVGSMRLRSILEATFRPIMPEISESTARRGGNGVRSINRRALSGILAGGLPLYGVVMIAADPLLRIWLGRRFTDVLPANFRLMLIGSFLSLLGVPGYYIFIGLGKVRDCLACVLLLVLANAGTVLTSLFVAGAVTVRTVSWGFVIGAGISTLYIRIRCADMIRGLTPGEEPRYATRLATQTEQC